MKKIEESELPENWELIDSELQRKFSDELKRELPSGHVLLGVNASAIARRSGRDDFLFILEGHIKRQLTWPVQRQLS